MKNILNKLFLFDSHTATDDDQETRYKATFLNNVFFVAAIMAFGMGFVRWQESVVMGMVDFGFSGLAFSILVYLRYHREKIELISSIALILSFILFFTIFLMAPHNTTRSSLFFLLSASAFFLKGRKAGFWWLVLILISIVATSLFTHIETAYTFIDLLTLSIYLVALFFIFDRYEAVKEEQRNHLERLNTQLDDKIHERTMALKQANQSLSQLNEELEAKVQERTQELIAAQEELVRKEKLATLGQVAGSVGHELRNPLGVMNNAVYYLKTVLADADDTTKEYLGIIENEIAGSERIVSDLLDSVRTKPPQPQLIGPAELIRISLGKCKMPENIKVDIQTETQLLLKADPLQISQIFINIIKNAADAMPDGGKLDIKVQEDKDSKMIKFSFRDSGTGISAENMKNLFTPLFTTKARGIGLGLVVIKNLTKANGGSVDVSSEPGKGTTFTLTFPMADERGISE